MESGQKGGSASLNGSLLSGGEGEGQVFVTLDTTMGAFPEVPTPQIVLEGAEQVVPKAGAPQKLICGDCSSTFADGDLLFRHWLERHCRPNENNDSVERMEQCHTCGRVFVGETEALRRHRIDCLAEAKVRPAKRKLEEESRERVAKRIPAAAAAAAALSCGVCLAEVRTVTSFFLHWLEAHSQVSEVLQEVWQCGQCRPGRLFPSHTGIAAAHVRQAHPPTRSIYQCAAGLDCKARCFTRQEAEAHRQRAHAQGSILDFEECDCEVCGCRVEAQGLSAHLSSVHAFENVWSRSSSLSRIAVTEQKDAVASPMKLSGKRKQKKPAPTSESFFKLPLSPPPAPDRERNASQQHQRCCSACQMSFSSEKLLEKHYLSNHEFQCKFCEAKMDKDVYGDHLRAHLATERKRGQVSNAK